MAERVGEDLVIYDEVSKTAYCLSPHAALVWERCDGRASQADIAAQLKVSPTVVERAVRELSACGLTAQTGLTRREAGKRFVAAGGVALAAPLIYSVAVPTAAAAGSLAICANPPNGFPPTMSGFMGYTVFALNGTGNATAPTGTQSGQFSLGTVNGKVGIAPKATITNMGPFVVNGNVYVATGGTFVNNGTLNGTEYDNQPQVVTDRTNAIMYSAQAAAMSPNQTFSSITTDTTIAATVSGLNVININGNINLGGTNNLTFTGAANDFFVVNVSGSITLDGSSVIGINLSGYPAGQNPATQLLINMTGSGPILNTHVGNMLDCTVLGPHVGGTIHSGNVSLLLGDDFSIMSGATVNGAVCDP